MGACAFAKGLALGRGEGRPWRFGGRWGGGAVQWCVAGVCGCWVWGVRVCVWGGGSWPGDAVGDLLAAVLHGYALGYWGVRGLRVGGRGVERGKKRPAGVGCGGGGEGSVHAGGMEVGRAAGGPCMDAAVMQAGGLGQAAACTQRPAVSAPTGKPIKAVCAGAEACLMIQGVDVHARAAHGCMGTLRRVHS